MFTKKHEFVHCHNMTFLFNLFKSRIFSKGICHLTVAIKNNS